MEISKVKGDFRFKGKQTPVVISDGAVTVGDFVVPGPGEYEVAGVTVIGLSGKVSRINLDNVSVLYQERPLSQEEKNVVGSVNILITPANVAPDAQIEAAYIIPFGTSEDVAKFAKGLGAENMTAQAKLVTSADKLPETTTVVVLE